MVMKNKQQWESRRQTRKNPSRSQTTMPAFLRLSKCELFLALYSQRCNGRGDLRGKEEEEECSRDSNGNTRAGASKGPEWRGYDGCFPEKDFSAM
jgi:hypothetical protein